MRAVQRIIPLPIKEETSMKPSRYLDGLCAGVLASLCCLNGAPAHATNIGDANMAPMMGQYASGDAFPFQDIPQLSRIVFEIGSCGPMLRSHWHDPSGLIIAAEELETSDEGFVRYRYWRPNMEESAVVTRSGPNMLSIEVDHGGRKERREVEVDGEVAAGPMMTVLAKDSLMRLKDGYKVPVRYVVPDKFATYAFNLVPVQMPETSRFGVSVMASSWAARQFGGKPLTVFFNDKGELQGMRGTPLLAVGTPDRKHPLDLDVQVNRRYSRPCSPEPVSNPRELAD
jgi:hypothetical protein